jgi:DNA-binding transcriptional MocR family regulator
MVAPKKVIRYPEAYRAAVMRRQMAEQQQAQVDTLNQQGAQEAVNQQLAQILLQQAAMKQAMAKAVSERDSPLGAYSFVFSKNDAPLPGFNKRKAIYQDLNLGNPEGERGY